MTTAVLQARDLAIGYAGGARRRVVADGLNLELHAGELVCLLGPNGAGKSTLLRTLACLQKPLRGQLMLAGDDVSRLEPREIAKRLSIVLTERTDVTTFSAYDLVSLGRYPYTDWTSRLSENDHQVVNWALEAVRAHDLAARHLGELSDGERQKVMIARALAQEPAVILLDEPTAYLDVPRRVEIMALLRDLARSTGRAILLSTHDLELALRTSDQVWLLADGVLKSGAPEDLILDGTFARAFGGTVGQGAQFQPETGGFVMHATGEAAAIGLVGDGLPAIWTRRALERAGFRVADSAPRTVTVHANVWLLEDAGQVESYSSIYDLLEGLR